MNPATFSVLAGLGLFFYGLRKLLRGFESFASSRWRPALQRTFTNPLSAWASGVGLTLFSQSGNLSVITLMGLTEIGFVGQRMAYFAMLGASAGTTAWLWYVLSGWHLGPLLLAVGAFGLILAKTEYWEEFMSVVLSIGFALMGLELLYAGVADLFGSIVTEKVVASLQTSDLRDQLPFVGLGMVLGLILQSASAPLVLLIAAIPAAQLTLATGTSFYLGANLGLTVTALILSRGTRAVTRRLAWSYLLSKSVGVLGALFLFPLFLELVQLVSGLVAGESANLLTQLCVAQVVFNIINSLIFGVLADPVLKLVSSYLPEKKIREMGLAKRVRRMLFQDADLAAKELERQLRFLELEVKANYDQVMQRLTTTTAKDTFKGRAMRERNFRSLKFTIHDLLFSVDRQGDSRHAEGAVILSLLEYYGALSRTLFNLENHYEKGLSKKFRLPPELLTGLGQFKALLDELWMETLLTQPDRSTEEESPQNVVSLEEIVLELNKRFGVEHQGYSTWLMETAGYLRLISSDLGQLLQRRSQLRALTEASSEKDLVQQAS